MTRSDRPEGRPQHDTNNSSTGHRHDDTNRAIAEMHRVADRHRAFGNTETADWLRQRAREMSGLDSSVGDAA